jgi:hypothetical protein
MRINARSQPTHSCRNITQNSLSGGPGDRTETHALSRSRSAILVSEYFVFLSRSATLQKKRGHRADLLRRRRSGKRQSEFRHWPACFLCAPLGLQRPIFDGPFFSVFNNLGDPRLTLASKYRILSCSCVTFLGILHSLRTDPLRFMLV